MEVILASQSPYRKAQLENFGLIFVAVKPQVDEEALKRSGPDNLEELTRFLALRKAESLHARFPEAIVLGSDQLAECAGERLDKPGSADRAKEQLRKLSGKTHRLITSLVVLSPEPARAPSPSKSPTPTPTPTPAKSPAQTQAPAQAQSHAAPRVQTFTDITRITLRALSDADIDAYLALDQPYDCAGSYKIERAGMALIQKVESIDPSAIQGLPLVSLTTAFKNLDIPWTKLWRTK